MSRSNVRRSDAGPSKPMKRRWSSVGAATLTAASIAGIVFVAIPATSNAISRTSSTRPLPSARSRSRRVTRRRAAGAMIRLPGHVLPALAGATPVAPSALATSAAENEPLTLTFVLKHDDQVGFDRYLRGLYDPDSPYYRRFLSQPEVSDRFGPSRETYRQIQTYLEDNGFEVAETSANRLTLTVRATRGAVARALDVVIGDYQLGDHSFYANDDDPALPAGLAAHVQTIAGLSNLARPTPSKKALRLGFFKLACYLALAPIPPRPGYKICDLPGPVTPLGLCLTAAVNAAENDADFDFDFLAYSGYVTYEQVVPDNEPCPPQQNFTALARATDTGTARAARVASGAGQKVAILAFDTFQTSDIADYLALIGLPASQLSKLSQVHVNGGATAGPDQDEVLLDVTTVMSIVPSASVVVYDGPFSGPGTSFQTLFNAAINGGATVISNSWAYCEDQTSLADVQGIDAIFQSAAMSNITIVNGAGDTGSTCLDGSPNTVAVPAGAPHAIAVGGSSVTAGQGHVYASETWWNGAAATPPTGQGGFGVSKFFTRPSYQDGFTASPMRSVPDVVASADPAGGVMICQASNGGCPSGLLYGGTSFTAPLWAAYTALINDARGQNLGFANPALYALAATPAFRNAAALSSDFAHVGLGSPNVDQLIVRLSGQTVGTPDSHASIVQPVLETQEVSELTRDVTVPADGATKGYVYVTLIDTNHHAVSGKTATLAANAGSQVTITPASGVSDARGTVVFTVKDLKAETVTFAGTDTTDAIQVFNTPTLDFVVPPAAGGSTTANPLNVTADGVASTTITVTLKDSLNRATPGKEIQLTQGTGHSAITGPSPSVTDATGQIQFTATDTVNETVTYSAVDVTDGDLAVPGTPMVTFGGGSNSSCAATLVPPVGANGNVVTTVATGFQTNDFNFGNVNWSGCPGASNPTFLGSGSFFVADFPNGNLYELGPQGGAVSNADVLAAFGPTLGQPTFGKDGSLYVTRAATTGNFFTGAIFQIDPDTGAVIRTVAPNLTCPNGLSVDPLSGDLFFDDACTGVGSDNASIFRVVNPSTQNPTVVTYATLPSTPNAGLAFAPNGTLYAATGYIVGGVAIEHVPIVRISGTDKPQPPTMTTLTGVTTAFGITIADTLPSGEAKSLLIGTFSELQLVDITTGPPTVTVLATGSIGPGVIAPDGCMYTGTHDRVLKLSRSDGGCGFVPTNPGPSLSLTPAAVTPDPAQGATQDFTATFQHLNVPAGTPVFFAVSGANGRVQMVRTDAGGAAAFSYTGGFQGKDVIVASATVNGDVITSNEARINWTAGKHTTFLTLNPSPTASSEDTPLQVSASLTDTSVRPPAPVVGATIHFALGGLQCADDTDASGIATCQLTTGGAALLTLTATFDGTAQLLPSSDAVGFNIVGGASLGHFMVYQTQITKGTPKFIKFGAVTLGDDFGSAGYDVLKPTALAAPADKNGSGFTDTATHLETYAVKRSKSSAKFTARADQHFVNQCDDAVVTVSKPVSLMVPTAKDLINPVAPPQTDAHNVDHFLCYKAKAQKKRLNGTPAAVFPKGVQVAVTDQFQSRRYDLKKLALVCNPSSKAGTPTLESGPSKGAPFPITPAAIRNPDSHLLCYTAKLAKKTIAQNGCGPATPGDKGTTISPAQAKHVPRLGVHVANQFGSGQIDTKKETMLCIPSVALP